MWPKIFKIQFFLKCRLKNEQKLESITFDPPLSLMANDDNLKLKYFFFPEDVAVQVLC